MNISLEQFKKEVEQLDVEMNNHFKEIPNQTKQHLKAKTGRQLIRDGIVDIEEYYKSPIRIMWVLKEPYDNKKNGGGGWAMKEILFKMVNGEKPKPQSTWHPIIYSTFGILNNFRKLETMPRIGNDKTVAAVLKQIAFINVQKLPATTVTIDKE